MHDRTTIATMLAVLMLLAATAAGADDGAYRLVAGDRVRVSVFGHDDLSGEFEVDHTGRISLPLVRLVRAAGYTADELAAEIRDSLQPDYLRDPKVSVEIIGYQPVFVLGEVRNPGSYPYAAGMTVVKAVALAGGYTYRADKGDIVVIRGEADRQRKTPVAEHAPLRPGDVIEVPERFF